MCFDATPKHFDPFSERLKKKNTFVIFVWTLATVHSGHKCKKMCKNEGTMLKFKIFMSIITSLFKVNVGFWIYLAKFASHFRKMTTVPRWWMSCNHVYSVFFISLILLTFLKKIRKKICFSSVLPSDVTKSTGGNPIKDISLKRIK